VSFRHGCLLHGFSGLSFASWMTLSGGSVWIWADFAKSRRTPRREIELALRRAREVMQ